MSSWQEHDKSNAQNGTQIRTPSYITTTQKCKITASRILSGYKNEYG